MDSLDRSGWFPDGNGRQFDRVHVNKTLSDDHVKVFHSGGIEGALGDLEGQTMFPEMLKDTISTFMMEGKDAIDVDVKIIHVNL